MLKEKYPFVNKLHYDDILEDLLENNDSNDERIETLENKKLYQHCIYFAVQHTVSAEEGNSYQSMIAFSFITNNDTEFTKQTFINYLNNISGNRTIRFMSQGFILYTAGDYAGKYGFSIQTSYIYDTSVLGNHRIDVRFLSSVPSLRSFTYDAESFVSSDEVNSFSDYVTLIA